MKESIVKFIARQYKENPEKLFLVCALSLALGWLLDEVISDLFSDGSILPTESKEVIQPHNPDIYRRD